MFQALLLLLWTAQAGNPEMIPLDAVQVVGGTAPVIEGSLLDGGSFDLGTLRGKPVVVSFWASWCGPCREELPALTDLAKQRNDAHFVTVNVDRDPAAARRFLQRYPTDLPVVLDPDAVALGAYQVASMPTMFVLDRNQTVKFQKVGFSRERGLTELISALDQERGR